MKSWAVYRLLVSKTLLGFLFLIPAFLEASVVLPFKGDIDFQKKTILVSLSPIAQNPFNFQVMQTADDQYKISAYLDHWQLAFFNISSTLEGSVKVSENKTVIQGDLVGKDVFINAQASSDLAGQFELRQGKLQIRSLSLGAMAFSGTIQMHSTHQTSLVLQIAGMEMSDFIFFLSGDRMENQVDGFIDGKVKIFGPLDRLFLRGKLFSSDGFIEEFPYQKIALNLQGSYPLMSLADSSVRRGDGLLFDIDGQIDLSNTKNFRQQIDALKREPVVDRKGTALEWTLKSVPSQDKLGTTEIKYRLEKGDDFDAASEKSSVLLGVQRKLEF